MNDRMTPTKLVQVEMYDYAELASEDQHVLVDAGIPAYVKSRGRAYQGVSLMVAAEDAERASAILSRTPSPFRQPKTAGPMACPYCGSSEIEGRPQYATIPLGLGFVTAALLTARGMQSAGFATFGVAAAIATVVFVRFARRRCPRCARVYPGDAH
jgi:hypothetical protein